MGGIALAIRKTCSAKGEENPWQALADAIIIQAVKDYRNRARMMKRIRGRLKKNKEMTPSELDYQAQRLQQYEEKQDIASNFFFSDGFRFCQIWMDMICWIDCKGRRCDAD